MKNGTRTELMAIPIVLVLLGGLFLLLLAADAGAWGWIGLGVAAVAAGALIVWRLARRPAHPPALDAPTARAPGADDGTFRVLVVSDGSSTSQAFHDEVAARAAGKPLEVLVVVPALGSRLSHWTGDDHARDEAQENLARTVEALAAAGVSARGEVGADDPLQAADDALRQFPADEIVFATHAENEAGWNELGVVESARDRYGLPVAHTLVDR